MIRGDFIPLSQSSSDSCYVLQNHVKKILLSVTVTAYSAGNLSMKLE